MNPVDCSVLAVEPTGVRGGVVPDVATPKPAVGIAMKSLIAWGTVSTLA
jgi:hypothetical protein